MKLCGYELVNPVTFREAGYPMGEEMLYHDLDSIVLMSVIVDGVFKTIVFQKVDDRCYIVVGETGPYRATLYRNGAVDGVTAIDAEDGWFEVTREVGNTIYKKIKATKRMTKNGRPYYRA